MKTRPYRPANGAEGDLFHEWFCFRCRHESEANPCEILTRSLTFNLGDSEYPAEWVENDVPCANDSNPRCTAFLAEGVEPSTYCEDERQVELPL